MLARYVETLQSNAFWHMNCLVTLWPFPHFERPLSHKTRGVNLNYVVW